MLRITIALALITTAQGCHEEDDCSALDLSTPSCSDALPPVEDARVPDLPDPDLSPPDQSLDTSDAFPSKAISLKLQRYAQSPGGLDCGPTSLRMVLHYWGGKQTEAEVVKHFTILPGVGVLDGHIGKAALALGYKPTIISYNYRVFHPAWESLSMAQLQQKLETYLPKITNSRDKVSVTAYVDYLKLSGPVKFQPLSRELIISYLKQGVPVIAALDMEYLYQGKAPYTEFKAEHYTHFVVVHGYVPQTDAFEISDPWTGIPIPHTGGQYFVSSPRLLTAILLGMQGNDADLIIVEK